jgi:hypothetical protein
MPLVLAVAELEEAVAGLYACALSGGIWRWSTVTECLQAEPISNEEEYNKFASSSDRSHVTVRWLPARVSRSWRCSAFAVMCHWCLPSAC